MLIRRDREMLFSSGAAASVVRLSGGCIYCPAYNNARKPQNSFLAAFYVWDMNLYYETNKSRKTARKRHG